MNLRWIGISVVLATAMAAATFAPVVFAVLATELRAEFNVARWQIGALVTTVTAVGAVISPRAGDLADRFLPRHSVAATLIVAGAGFLAIAAAPSYPLLVVAAIPAGLAQGLANPATNRLIMSQAEQGKRGVLTGIKQAGVQGGNFAGGILLPLGAASAMGWRGTVASAAWVVLTGLFILAAAVRARPRTSPPAATPATGDGGPAIHWLSAYSGVMGICTGAILTYLPIFAEEGFRFSNASAGALVATYAGVAFVTRLAAGTISERWLGHGRTLAAMAAFTAVAGGLLAFAPNGRWLWPAAILIGVGPVAWNVVANVAVMELAPTGQAGRGSGIMMAGFLAGMALGAPLFGWSVDVLATYRPGWLAVALLGSAGAVLARKIKARGRARGTVSASIPGREGE